METPVTTGGRRRARCPERRKSQHKENIVTSTPTAYSSSRNVSILSYVEECDRKSSSRQQEGDEEEDCFPSTQQGRLKSSGEVYWNFDESPGTTEALRKKLAASDSPLPPTKPPPVTSSLNFIIKEPTSKAQESDVEGQLELLSYLKELSAKHEQTLVENDKSDTTLKSPSIKDKSDVFCSDDDSFLFRATQAAEEEAEVAKPPAVVVPRPNVEEKEDPFGDDDGFDSLICQIDTEALENATVVKSSAVSVPSSSGPKPVVKDPSEKKVQAGQAASSSFKRFKSADSVTNQVNLRNSTSGNIMKSWRRCHSSPESSKASTNTKCSREEIEKKKQEALRRLRQKSQQQK